MVGGQAAGGADVRQKLGGKAKLRAWSEERRQSYVVDVFSRFLWALPLETENSGATTQAVEEILRESSRNPWKLDTDGGVEFTGGAFEPFLESKEI